MECFSVKVFHKFAFCNGLRKSCVNSLTIFLKQKFTNPILNSVEICGILLLWKMWVTTYISLLVAALRKQAKRIF